MTQPEGDWALYAAHRAHLTAALRGSAPEPGGRLCLLGAGKSNDIDLAQLAEHFSEIHLVDIDAPAVASAVARQTPEVRARLRVHVPVDLSGLSSKKLGKWQRKAPTRTELEAYETTTLAGIIARLPGPFDVVASTCILTQMSFALRQALGERHPMLAPIRLALMATHLRSLAALTLVGGNCLFACDVVSSTSYPLEALGDRDLNDVLREVVASGSSYFAANPKLIVDTLRHHPDLAERASDPEQLPPWLWTGPLGRTYLVYALRFERL